MADVTVSIIDADVSVSIDEADVVVHLGSSGPQGARGSQILSGSINPSSSIGLIGDQYINTDTGYLFGPKTESGWGVGVPLGTNDPNDLGQAYYLTSPSTQWDISHTLAFIPNVTIVDLSSNTVECAIEYINDSTIRATFSEPFTGAAFLS